MNLHKEWNEGEEIMTEFSNFLFLGGVNCCFKTHYYKLIWMRN